ncbi:hypothetical protein QN409_24595, partial [Pseudomonas sp. MH9.3]|uniref:hypothetical protein n=1 Tax=Pseudomonas sp. MH9.3 TaxID=3048630 RepID=UPI002B22AA5C
CAFFPYPLSPPEERSEGVNLIQDGTAPTKKPATECSVAGFFVAAILTTPEIKNHSRLAITTKLIAE